MEPKESESLGQIVRFWGAVDFKADPVFYDHLYPASRHIQDNWADWQTDSRSVLFYDHDTHRSLRLAHSRVSFEAASPSEFAVDVSYMATRAHDALKHLYVKSCTRMGLKVVVCVDVGLPFEDLLKVMRPLCLPDHAGLTQITSGNVTDIALFVDYHREDLDLSAMLRAGPMKRQQSIDFLSRLGKVDRLFRPATEGKDVAEFYANVPEDSLYFDIDVFVKREGIGLDEWTSFVARASKHAIDALSRIRELISENDE